MSKLVTESPGRRLLAFADLPAVDHHILLVRGQDRTLVALIPFPVGYGSSSNIMSSSDGQDVAEEVIETSSYSLCSELLVDFADDHRIYRLTIRH